MTGIPPAAARAIPAGLAILLVGSTLGEGGAAPTALLVAHALVAALASIRLVSDPRSFAARLDSSTIVAFSAFGVMAVVGGLRAPYAFAAHLVLLEIATFAGVAWLASGEPRRTLSVAVPVLLAAGAVHGAWALVQRIVNGEARAATSFLNPNHLAAWLVAVFFIGLGRALAPATDGTRRRLHVIALMAVAAGIASAASRGALVGALVGSFAWAGVAWRALPRRGIAIGITGVGVAAALAGFAIHGRFESVDPFAYSRPRIWRASLEVVAREPLWGAGPGQFAMAALTENFPVEEAPLRFARSFATPHSDWLRAPCEFGWPAAALLLLAVVLAARAAARNATSGGLGADGPGILAALAALAAQGAVDDLTARPAVWLLAAVVLGAAVARPRADDGAHVSAVGRIGAIALLAMALAAGEIGPYFAWSESRGLPRGRLDEAQSSRLAAAIARNPFHPDLRMRLAEHEAPPGARALSASAYAAAREAAEIAIRLSPQDPSFRVGLARVEATGTRLLLRDVASRDRAAARYAEGERLAPHDPLIALEKGEFLLVTGDPAGAARAAERALEIEPRSVLPRLLLAEALVEQGAGGRRALALIDEAERLAADHAGVERTSHYERALLTLDDDRCRRIRGAVATSEAGR